ncbi:MAG: multidrug effflux MFS transporter [Rhizobiaceae bacterium]|nr:multidrug effflux MFS transporter [Rhizobiaceae bacterium]
MTAGRMSETRTSVIGAFLVALGPISMALYTPAMPELVKAFGTTESMIKLTLSLYFGGFACAQLIAGTLSDAFGRRPVTVGFMIIYLIGSLMSAFAPTVEVLIVGRLVQGIGASAGMTVARAIVRDQFTGNKSAAIMNLMGMMLAVGPALAPTIGSISLELFGWQSIFFIMVAFSVAACFMVWFAMEETTVPDVSKARLRPILRGYGEILTDPRFVSGSLVIGGAVGILYTLASVLPFVLIDRVGLTPLQYGLGMLMQSGSYFVGSVVVRWLLRRVGAASLMVPGLLLIAVGAAGLVVSIHALPLSFLSVMLPVGLCAFGIAFVTPYMMTAAVAPFPHVAGAAAAMMGFVQMASGLVGGMICAAIGAPVFALQIVIPAFGLVAIVSYVVYAAAIRARPLSDLITPARAQPAE